MRLRGREHQTVQQLARRWRAAQQRASDPVGRQQTRLLDGERRQFAETSATGDETVGGGEQRIEADGCGARLKRDRILVGPLTAHLRGQLVERDAADILRSDVKAAKNHVPHLAVARRDRPAMPDARPAGMADLDRVIALASEDHRAHVVALQKRLELAARIGDRRNVVKCVDNRPSLVLGGNRRRKSGVPARHPEVKPRERLPQHPIALEPVRQDDHRLVRLKILSIEPGGEELGRRQRRGPERSVEARQERNRDQHPHEPSKRCAIRCAARRRAHPHRAQNRDREEHVYR